MERENTPIYMQIHDQLKEEIEAGKWAIGDRLPPERELADVFHVSRMTLRQAIQTLVDEGIIERRVGSGTYVARQKVQEKMSGVTSFSEIIRSQGKVPSSKTVAFYVTHPSRSEQEKLSLNSHQKILRMERIRYADDVPICYEVASIPYDLIQHFTKKEITQSFYQVLETKGKVKPGHATQTITALCASDKVADYLEIKKNSALLRLRQISYLTTGEPFEYVRSQYVGSRFEFVLEK